MADLQVADEAAPASPAQHVDEDRARRRGRLTRIAPYAAALAWYAAFVGRASGDVAGKRAFPLFDDAMISMTYARNLASGHGLQWNVGGPRVEGITDPLWTAVMAVPHLLHVGDRLSGLVIILFGVALLAVSAELARAIVVRLAPDRPIAAEAVPWLVLFCYPLVYWTLRGMEVGAMTTLLLGALLLALRLAAAPTRRDLVLLCAVVAAGLLTRLDFAVVVPPVLLVLAVRRAPHRARRELFAVAGVTAATLAAQELARRIYYGKWLPNTYALKVGHTALADRLDRGARSVVFTLAVSGAAAAVFAGLALWRRRDTLLACVLTCALAVAAYDLYVGGDAWEWMRYANRYLTPGLVCLLCVAAVGIAEFADAMHDDRVRAVVASGLLLAAALVALNWLPAGAVLFKLPPRGEPGGQRLALLPVLLVVVLAGPLTARVRRRGFARLLTAGVACSVGLAPFAGWVAHGAFYTNDDVSQARSGLELRNITTSDASIGVVGAGNVIYFAHRRGVDILGKSDPRIAAGPVRPETGFFPGHMKWNYRISLVDERPDLIQQLWITNCADYRLIAKLGYLLARARVPITTRPDVYLVRRDSPRIRWDALVVTPHKATDAALLQGCT